MIADGASGRLPAYLDTGLNIVHVDDVAEGHILALERGPHGRVLHPGRRGFFAARGCWAWWTRRAGRQRRRMRLHESVLWPVALACEGLARVAGIEPVVTRDTLLMARKQMFFSSAKARAGARLRATPGDGGDHRRRGLVPAPTAWCRRDLAGGSVAGDLGLSGGGAWPVLAGGGRSSHRSCCAIRRRCRSSCRRAMRRRRSRPAWARLLAQEFAGTLEMILVDDPQQRRHRGRSRAASAIRG